MPNNPLYLTTAVESVVRAGDLMLERFGTNVRVDLKGAIDLVTEVDVAIEREFRARIAERFPEHTVFGEEMGGSATAPEGPCWVFDPIDGTTNFAHGHPFWCVSVGLVLPSGESVLGVVRAPALGTEHYALLDDEGAVLSRRATSDGEEDCKVSGLARFEESLLATGFPYDRKTSPDNNFDSFVAIKKKCQAVRRCGSAALDLCLVADGTYEGYWERKLRPWDIAAGIAIVRGAGGRISTFDATALPACNPLENIVATNGRIHDALLAELGSASPR